MRIQPQGRNLSDPWAHNLEIAAISRSYNDGTFLLHPRRNAALVPRFDSERQRRKVHHWAAKAAGTLMQHSVRGLMCTRQIPYQWICQVDEDAGRSGSENLLYPPKRILRKKNFHGV